MSQAQTNLPHITVKVAYKTRTPFLYCELEGRYQDKPISITVIESTAGQSETIIGLLHHAVTKHARECSGEHTSEPCWAATIRTSRVNMAPLFNREPRAEGVRSGFVLSWTPDPEAVPSARSCDAKDVIFGRFPDLQPLHLGVKND
jgi:hypothetical protein